MKPTSSTLDIDIVCMLIDRVMTRKYKIAPKFIEFLKETGKKLLTSDQWTTMIDVFEIYERHDKYSIYGPCIIST